MGKSLLRNVTSWKEEKLKNTRTKDNFMEIIKVKKHIYEGKYIKTRKVKKILTKGKQI